MAVRDREAAKIGFLIALDEPTVGMKGDAASAGFYAAANFEQAAKEAKGQQSELL